MLPLHGQEERGKRGRKANFGAFELKAIGFLAIDKGVTFVSAAGNNGGISYESTFRSGAEFELGDVKLQAHDFDIGENIYVLQNINVLEENTLIRSFFAWDEPIEKTEAQYIQFLVNTPKLPNVDNVVGISVLPNQSAIDTPILDLSYAFQKVKSYTLLLQKLLILVIAELIF